ncbi:hypothetical protein [Paenisporosarcina sp.]|uniref:hypothetical protein n=1 Tax=Paenisporosarcina sp. TaxID=1932001 RepID=UPI003C75BF1C
MSQSVEKKSTELVRIKENMSKVEKMDRYLKSVGNKTNGKEVRETVKVVFGADLNYISEKNYGSNLSVYNIAVMESLRISLNVDSNSSECDAQIMAMTKNEVMDRYIEVHEYSLTGAECRVLINQIFGVNLDGISGLEHSKVSIYSKGQWILQGDTNLFIVSSSLDDVELYVTTTDYYEESVGSNQLPDSLKQKLISIGFTYDADQNRFIYRNPTNESVPDAFKGQVIGNVLESVAEFTNKE